MRAPLPGASRRRSTGGIAEGLGLTGIQPALGTAGGEACTERSSNARRHDEGDEPSAGELAPRGSADRTTEYYRFSQVEEPDGGIQRRFPARRITGRWGGGESAPGT